MKFNELRLKDKALFNKFLHIKRYDLSTYAFANIFTWKVLFKIFWIILEDNLCIFFKDDSGAFMYLAPLGERKSAGLIGRCFQIMDNFNLNKDISRIENVEEKNLDFYRHLGYEAALKSSDYICNRDSLVSLKGNAFKSKRWAYNYFIRNYKFQYEPFDLKRDKDQCLSLCSSWVNNRKRLFNNSLYRYMLDDSFSCQRIALDKYNELALSGSVVKIDGEIKGYTFGFRLNQDTFCILFEVTDLSTRGLSQFIFRQFCCELKDYRYINIMDDSGLENLQKVKLSYRPLRLAPSYIVKREL